MADDNVEQTKCTECDEVHASYRLTLTIPTTGEIKQQKYWACPDGDLDPVEMTMIGAHVAEAHPHGVTINWETI